jgi:hypothetical protein
MPQWSGAARPTWQLAGALDMSQDITDRFRTGRVMLWIGEF